jgi:hypothetical protein
MVRGFRRALLATAVLVAGGCVPEDFLQLDPPGSNAAIVPTSPFASAVPVPVKTVSNKAAPAAPETLILVDKIGQALVAANPSIAMKPHFLTITQAEPEIFHQGTSAIFITDGLVKKCATPDQLAAVLSLELGRMVSEREVLTSPEIRNPEKRLPMTVPIGNAGQFTGLEQLNQAEVAALDCDRRRPSKRFVPPDPEVLARKYLQAVNVDAKELDAAKPLLAQAEQNYAAEKQLVGQNQPMHWQPQ